MGSISPCAAGTCSRSHSHHDSWGNQRATRAGHLVRAVKSSSLVTRCWQPTHISCSAAFSSAATRWGEAFKHDAKDLSYSSSTVILWGHCHTCILQSSEILYDICHYNFDYYNFMCHLKIFLYLSNWFSYVFHWFFMSSCISYQIQSLQIICSSHMLNITDLAFIVEFFYTTLIQVWS